MFGSILHIIYILNDINIFANKDGMLAESTLDVKYILYLFNFERNYLDHMRHMSSHVMTVIKTKYFSLFILSVWVQISYILNGDQSFY